MCRARELKGQGLRRPDGARRQGLALAHLLSNGRLADVVLFGSFLVWAVLSFRAARQRDRAAGDVPLPLYAGRDVITAFVGIFAWIIFALWLHGPLIGVRPFG